ncbi:hypothetical protein SH611_15590 [Geminicoccaceae bacterium 1502E]|nr:hypothetical protein [Geminicoccaceae bacterium 1502E]
MIDVFIADAARQTGLSVTTVREVSGRLLAIAEAGLGSQRLEEIVRPIPGAMAMLDASRPDEHALAQIGGDVGTGAIGHFGGESGVTWIAQETGLPQARVARLAELLAAFLDEKSGATAGRDFRHALPLVFGDEQEE